MKSILDTLNEKIKENQRHLNHSQPPLFDFKNERQVLIQEAVDKINSERKGTKYKPVTWGQINGIVSHLKGFDLKWFLQECHKSPIFGQAFFGRLKKKVIPFSSKKRLD